MAEETARLGLPYLLTNQAQKEVTHNEALDKLDFYAARVVVGIVDSLPASPIEGDAFIMRASNNIIHRVNGAWETYVPFEGLKVVNTGDGKTYTFLQGSWAVDSGGGTDIETIENDLKEWCTTEILGGAD